MPGAFTGPGLDEFIAAVVDQVDPRLALARPFAPAGEDHVDPRIGAQFRQLDHILADADPAGIVDQDDHRRCAALVGIRSAGLFRAVVQFLYQVFERFFDVSGRIGQAGGFLIAAERIRVRHPLQPFPALFRLGGIPQDKDEHILRGMQDEDVEHQAPGGTVHRGRVAPADREAPALPQRQQACHVRDLLELGQELLRQRVQRLGFIRRTGRHDRKRRRVVAEPQPQGEEILVVRAARPQEFILGFGRTLQFFQDRIGLFQNRALFFGQCLQPGAFLHQALFVDGFPLDEAFLVLLLLDMRPDDVGKRHRQADPEHRQDHHQVLPAGQERRQQRHPDHERRGKQRHQQVQLGRRALDRGRRGQLDLVRRQKKRVALGGCEPPADPLRRCRTCGKRVPLGCGRITHGASLRLDDHPGNAIAGMV